MARSSVTGNWSDREVLHLIELWGEEGMQEQLEGAKRNKHIYERLAAQLGKIGSDNCPVRVNYDYFLV